MKNDDLLKLARWIVPGWTCIGAIILFIALDVISTPSGRPHIYASLKELLSIVTNNFNALGATTIIFIAGVPLGFSIYQAYYYLRWNSPFSKNGFIALLPGRKLDLELSTIDIKEDVMSMGEEWRENIVNHPLFYKDHGFTMRYIESLFEEAIETIEKEKSGFSWYSRYRYLHEMVHTLGASIGAIYIGFMVYLAIKMPKENLHGFSHIFSVIVIAGILFLLMYFEDKARLDAIVHLHQKDYTDKLKDVPITASINLPIEIKKTKIFKGWGPTVLTFVYPSALYIFALLSVNLLLNPAFSIPNFDYIDMTERIGLLLIVFSLWARTQDKDVSIQRGIRATSIGFVILFIVCAVIKYFSFSYVSTFLDWPYLTSITFFAITNLVLLFNRRNARDEMLALEYYVLKRYFSLLSHNVSKKR